METNELEKIRSSASAELTEILDSLKKDAPEISEYVATALGATAGGAVSLATGLSTIGTVLGSLVGFGVLIPVLGAAGYALMRKRKNSRKNIAINNAIEKLIALQNRLQINVKYFQGEIKGINVIIEELKKIYNI